MKEEIEGYHNKQTDIDKAICDLLYSEICRNLPHAEHKLWHGHPVWFIDGNPVVGYSKLKGSVRVLFWSGQSFDEPGLSHEGSFKAAEIRYTGIGDIDIDALARYVHKAETIQWDYKNIISRRGVLMPVTGISEGPFQGGTASQNTKSN